MEGVSICSPLCQHPSCWLALRRSLVKGTGQAQGEANRCSHPVTRDSNADKTTGDGSLPVVKVWDLLETYARSSVGLPEDFNSPWSYQPSPVDKKKRYEKWKQKKVKKQDREQTIKSNLTSTSTASFQVLAPELPDASSRKQFYTWVPPSSTRKPLHIPAKKPKEVHVRDLTGELMPSDMASKHVCRVHRKSNRSQEGNYEAHGYWSRVLNKIYGLDDMLNMPEQLLLRILKSAAHSQGRVFGRGCGFAPPAFEGCDDGENEDVPEGAGSSRPRRPPLTCCWRQRAVHDQAQGTRRKTFPEPLEEM
ncbi:PREDICTED: uncharacterized protein LOC106811824 [Priapulus caudatus]|uniref:Uncharacterized protein LOC106811824 n=1 Tax=Priapulus caudatus TaxID=37621 RepID=A0ABM1EFR0_PRICU|nr:PREDICTED: uncharacterized protein LOC106811824 [Priapulus caudatus]